MSVNKQHQFVIHESHPCLAGHFPGRPIVPGVVLLDHVIKCIEDQFQIQADDVAGSIIRISSAKFLHKVLPNQPVQLEFTVNHEKIDFLGTIQDIPVIRGSGRFMRKHSE